MAIILGRKPGGASGGGAPSGPAGGDLTGTYPNPTLASGVVLFNAYAYLRDEKTAGTPGGTFNAGAWRTRDLNTEVFDPDGIVSLAANQFTLAAGTYFIEANALSSQVVARNKLKIANVTDATDVLIGANAFTAVTNDSFQATVRGRFTIAGSKAFELQHRCELSSGNTQGFGIETNLGVVEIYAEVMIYRES